MIGGLRLSTEWSGPPRALPNSAAMLRALSEQMLVVAQFVKAVWIARAQQLNISDSGDYVRGIAEEGIIRRVYEQGTLTSLECQVEIINTSRHAAVVEDGHVAFHLPSEIDWTKPSVKHGKKGPYLNIPFRHFTPTSKEQGGTHTAIRHQMPEFIYQQARELGPRERLRHAAAPGMTLGPDGNLHEFRRSARGIAGRVNGERAMNPTWKVSKYANLVRRGAEGHTRYMTFRTITPDSDGWHIPAQPGRGVARQVAFAVTHGEGGRKVSEMLRRAMLEGR